MNVQVFLMQSEHKLPQPEFELSSSISLSVMLIIMPPEYFAFKYRLDIKYKV